MLTVYNEKKKRLFTLHGNVESIIRTICEENSKVDSMLFYKKQDNVNGKITFKSLKSTEARTNVGNFYFWKNYIIDFKVS